MAENDSNPQPGATAATAGQPAATAGQPGVKVNQRVLAQYIRDLSFENVLAQKGASPDVVPEMAVTVNLDARKRGENTYEVLTKLKVTSKAKSGDAVLFLLEIEYAGIFEVTGLAEDQLHPYLLIECPRVTFPFLRRIVSDISRDGGFPPVNLEMIDFVALYRSEIARRLAEQQKNGEAEAPAAQPTLNA